MLSSIVLDVLRQPPGDDRSNHPMFESTLTWLRRTSDMFSHLSGDVLSEMIKRCGFISIPANTVIMKQGDEADSFYALLNGHASAWVLPSTGGDDDVGSKLDAITRGQQLSSVDKHKLGVCVKKYAPGGTFGELALITEKGVRNASIITDNEPCNFATINRELYNKLLLTYQKKDYEERLELCNACPLFTPIAKNHRIKLAMAMEKIHLEFDNFVAIQSQPAAYLYFIVKGNAKVIVDPEMHEHQNNILPSVKSLLTSAVLNQMEARKNGRRLHAGGGSTSGFLTLTSAGGSLTYKDNNGDVSRHEIQHKIAKAKTAIALAAQRRALVMKPGVQEVCWVHPGEIVGDAEAVLGLDTYLWSVIAAEPMEIFALSLYNFRRIYQLYKNNEHAAIHIEEECYNRLADRFERIDTPFSRRLLDHLATNLEEVYNFYNDQSKPKLPPLAQPRDWAEKLDAFRKRRPVTAERREKHWTPPKPCCDAKTITDFYEAWQNEQKHAALVADENNAELKALTKEERRLNRLHRCGAAVSKQQKAASLLFRKFTQELEAEKHRDDEEEAEFARSNTTYY